MANIIGEKHSIGVTKAWFEDLKETILSAYSPSTITNTRLSAKFNDGVAMKVVFVKESPKDIRAECKLYPNGLDDETSCVDVGEARDKRILSLVQRTWSADHAGSRYVMAIDVL